MITIENYIDKKDTIDWGVMPKNILNTRKDVEEIMEFYDDDADIKEAVDLFLKGINENKGKGILEDKTSKLKPKDIKITVGGKNIPVPKTPWVIYSNGQFATKKTTQSDYSFTDNDNFAYTWPDSEQEKATEIARKLNAIAMPLDQALEMQEVFISNKKNAEKKQTIPFIDSKFKNNFDVYTGRYYSDADLFSYDPTQVQMDEVKSESEFKNLKNKRVLIYRPKTLSSMEEQGSQVRNVMLYAKFKDQKAFKAIGDGRQVENLLYATIFPIENIEKLKASITPGDDVHFQIRVAGGPKVLWDSKEDQAKKPTTKTTKVTKAKVAKVIVQKKIITITPEYLLIKRFWNIIKNEKIVIPFRTTQLLNMAFNKAAVERKVRKTSEAADLFSECQKKINVLFQDFAAPTQADVKVDFTDKKLYAQIQEYVTTSTVNPAVPVINRFIAMQNTLPDVKKAETLLKSVTKIIDNDKNNRLIQELNQARVALEKYIAKPKETIEPKVYGLSVPAVCTNRVKCAGIDKSGKLLKGYKFEEHTGHVVRVRKTKSRLASPNVCENRVKCTGLSKSGKLLPGYKFEEGTNHVVKVLKSTAKKKSVKKKVAAGLGLVFNQGIESIYADPYPVTPIIQNKVQDKVQVIEDFDYSTLDPTGNQGQSSTISEPIKKERINVPINRNSLAYRREKNKNVAHEYYKIEDEDISEFLGNIEKKKKESVAITVAGGQGSGKTSLIFQLINAFSKNYKVGHASLEEHPESALYELKADRFWDDTAKATVDSPEIKSMKDIHDLIMRNDVIVIDSFSKLQSWDRKITLDETFRKKYDGKLFIVIYQLTTSGSMRGGSTSQFDGDVILFVEKFENFNDNYVYADKNRYQNKSLDKLHYNIASEKLVPFQPEQNLEFSEEVESI